VGCVLAPLRGSFLNRMLALYSLGVSTSIFQQNSGFNLMAKQ
jgi:hypothetical protein